jgi:hypothetical protein
VITPAPRVAWQRLVDCDANALPFQTPAWTDAVCRSGRWADASRLYQFADGREVMLPLVRRRRPGGTGLTTLASMPPQWGSGGAVAAEMVSPADAAVILEDLHGAAPLRVLLRPNPLVSEPWAVASGPGTTMVRHVAHVLDLGGGFERVYRERFHSRTRTNLRRAERSRLTIERGTGGELISEFHALYLRWAERRARERHVPLPLARRRAEPLRRLELIARCLGTGCRVWHVRQGGRPVAGLILAVHGANAVYLRGCSDLELTRPTRANDLLQSLAIEESCRDGCRYYHMGESGGVASLARFKERFGAVPYTFSELRLERVPVTAVEDWAGRVKGALEARLLAAGH